jgi:uncharacterized protein with gpF-like domain
MFRTTMSTWMTATAAAVEVLMNRSRTSRTELAISGKKGLAIAILIGKAKSPRAMPRRCLSSVEERREAWMGRQGLRHQDQA